MKTETPDVLVVGLGAMGSATIYHLARQGANVVGIDRFAPPHTHGSTHGETRITRQAIGEGVQFVPLALRSHQLWREIEQASGESLLTICGGLIVARAGQLGHLHEQADFLGDTLRAAEQFGIAHERLDAAEIARRYPQLVLHGDETGYFEPGAGYVLPEACVRAQLALATKHGATLRSGERATQIKTGNGATIVETDRARYAAGVTIVSTGAWIPQLLPMLATTLTVRRQVLYWFQLDGSVSYAAREFPVFMWPWGDGDEDVFYGFPQIGDARVIKVATEQCTTSTSPDDVNRAVGMNEIAAMYQRHVAGRLRGVSAHCVKSATCLYTNAPAANFIIDRLPDAPDAIVVSACSGHGFKHSVAIGESVAAMALTPGAAPAILRPFTLKARNSAA